MPVVHLPFDRVVVVVGGGWWRLCFLVVQLAPLCCCGFFIQRSALANSSTLHTPVHSSVAPTSCCASCYPAPSPSYLPHPSAGKDSCQTLCWAILSSQLPSKTNNGSRFGRFTSKSPGTLAN
ncbi:G-protein coupled receptor-associated protein [Trichinella spiralis]|uniref:G-protein coupled receptor-associated protein n=1 Tax=Trichinella spiralis TaxID=6334 RepID=A0ABR3KUA5_TRISP